MAGSPESEAVAVVVVSGVGNDEPGSARDMMVTTLLADPQGRWTSAQERALRLTALAHAGPSRADDPTALTTGAGAPEHREVFDVAAAELTGAPGTAPVHVYEMYWADLSRAQGAFSRVFYLLMAITLQIATIGLEAVRRFMTDARAAAPDAGGSHSRTLSWLHWTMNAVSYWLVYAITPVTLTMATLLMTLNGQLLMPDRSNGRPWLPDWAIVWIIGALGALAGWWIAKRIVGGGWTFQSTMRPGRSTTERHVWFIVAASVLAIAAGAAGVMSPTHRDFLLLAAVAGTIVVITLTADLVAGVDAEGVRLAGRITAIRLGFVLGPLGAAVFAAKHASGARTAELLAAISLRLDRAVWLVLLGGCLLVAVLAAWFRRTGNEDRDERRQLSMSVLVTLVIGPLLFSVTTTGMFVFFSFLSRQWPGGYPDQWGAQAPTTPAGGIFTNSFPATPTDLGPERWGNRMIGEMVQPLGLALIFAGLLVAVVIAAAAPYIGSLAAGNRVRSTDPPPTPDLAAHRITASLRQGRHFTRILTVAGSGWMFVLASVFWSALSFAAAVVFWVPGSPVHGHWTDRVAEAGRFAGYWVVLVGVVAAAAAVGLKNVGVIRFLGRPLAKGMTAALDVVYDIASYLRTGQPGIVAPRIKMVARYRAILAHLADAGYARVVLCAHSQGTQLTYATIAGDADRLPPLQAAARVPANLELVTYGSPLAQTYRRRLPRQFAAMGPPLTVTQLRRHVNIYRAGDYIGRSLTASQPPTDPRSAIVTGAFSERCLGTGHHTGYGADERWRVAIRSLIVHPMPYTAADLTIAGLDPPAPPT